jgi:hypothetical protein
MQASANPHSSMGQACQGGREGADGAVPDAVLEISPNPTTPVVDDVVGAAAELPL